MSQSEVIATVRPERATARNRTGLFRSELLTLFRRLRTLAILAGLAGIPALLAVAVKIFSAPGPNEGPPFLYQVASNGLFVALAGLVVTLPLFLPLAVGVVAGDSVAGEANQGTLRYLLVVPTGRIRLLLVKLGTAIVFCLVAAFTVALVGMAFGAALFPLGPVTLLSGDTIGSGAALGRALLVAGYLGLSLAGLATIGVFISTLTDVPIAAMAATVTLAIVSQIVDSIPQLHAVHPWLFTHYWLAFGDLLRQPIYTPQLFSGLVLQLGYVLVFGLLAWARFSTRDVLS
ncbi:MAG: ABC transporter permease [Mycobacteriales bacterium]